MKPVFIIRFGRTSEFVTDLLKLTGGDIRVAQVIETLGRESRLSLYAGTIRECDSHLEQMLLIDEVGSWHRGPSNTKELEADIFQGYARRFELIKKAAEEKNMKLREGMMLPHGETTPQTD